MNRRLHPVSLQQAADESPTLASLAARVRETNERMQAIQELIPREMHGLVRAGPVDEGTWCLLVQGNSAAAKLRQLLPMLQSRLVARGWESTKLRIKVQVRH
ncbi:putative Zn-ribbon-containing RNA-binding protein [Burkholderiales bacterium 8X]|nr:putative Zn-ribbon-containing RNA-binding protein [Burkholderiales bacterium 8X]